ncbi:CRISPR-associated endoribonuclease Cas6 [Clostridium felsineum]|uniref:CRISPR-associated endoribonuclease Cas6 n=1 Tax=Clostridium felsineum TaxID=36839 RepID=UPI00098C627D|nr:CRISPR-associated endoribonuclease Cas6 [Clostridium felsineum]URZ18105.1 hypothetical protein CLFE_041600 [Clostridium felsineum DSM 794]
MKYFELIVTVMLKKDIFYADSGYIIGRNIDKSMILDEELKEIHPKNQFKNYVFDNLYPLEKDKVYKKGRLYVFRIRGIEQGLMQKLQNCMINLINYDFEVISISFNEVQMKKIKELYTINPVIITVNDEPWLQSDKLNIFMTRIEANLEKKYKNLFNDDIDLSGTFIEKIQFKNRFPMYFNYKGGIKLLGNKVSLEIEDNENAQKAAFVAMAVGLGEKNSVVGAGFCRGR